MIESNPICHQKMANNQLFSFFLGPAKELTRVGAMPVPIGVTACSSALGEMAAGRISMEGWNLEVPGPVAEELGRSGANASCQEP